MTAFGKRLIEAAKEARAIARGEADPGSYRIHVPTEIDIKALRAKLRLSQTGFAQKFGFNLARIKDWEQGRSKPDGAVRAYLMVIAKEPAVVERTLRPPRMSHAAASLKPRGRAASPGEDNRPPRRRAPRPH